MVYMEKRLVDSAIDEIADVVPGKENARIRARVIRLWKVPAFLNPSESSSIEMVLIDDKGGKIHATIRKQLIHVFDSQLEEGQVYEMSNFSVFPQSGNYRTTLHPYKIVFQLRTKVAVAEGSNITQLGIGVTSLAEIGAYTHDYEFLVDVIGLMTGISTEREYVRDGKLTKMVVIELTDHSGKCECALFGEYVDELNKKMGKSSTGGLPIVVVQFAKVKIFRDKASLQNVLNTTRILINPDIPEAEAFKNSIAVHGIENDAAVPMIGEWPKPSVEDEFLRMHPKKSVGELNNLCDAGVFVVCAQVVRVVDGQDWWYPACKCHKAVVPESGSYFCSACDRCVFQVIPRFRVKIEVTDGKDSCVFVLFDSDVSYMMEKSCAFFVARAKAKIVGPHPIEFDSLVGKKMLFAVDKSVKQSSVGDGSCRVRRVCMNPTIIEEFCGEGGFRTPSKGRSPSIDMDSDGLSDDVDAGEDTPSVEFVKDLIVTPPAASEVEDVDSDGPFIVKRNLSKAFDAAARPKRNTRLKKVKIEMD
ncbi:replication factor A protein [Trifolium medium]|uniref:Replication factor A protein n=1 Tax=Trifolium medium TaxID=97028 RepID=A0A392LZ09_9FABA|nr:replication factor A protein [Trifolium medium]